MKQWVRAAMAVCICALCLLLGSCLIQQQDAPLAGEETEPLAVSGLLMQRCVMPTEGQVYLSGEDVVHRKELTTGQAQMMRVPVTRVMCDGNGWIITGRTWPRTVYAVCPPEGMPG